MITRNNQRNRTRTNLLLQLSIGVLKRKHRHTTMPKTKQSLNVNCLAKASLLEQEITKERGIKAIKLLLGAIGDWSKLRSTATTSRSTSRALSICSHRKVIIAKGKESRQEHTQQRKGKLV